MPGKKFVSPLLSLPFSPGCLQQKQKHFIQAVGSLVGIVQVTNH